MFAGHAAVALAARSKMPGFSLGLFFAAAFWIDLIWPILILVGLESVRIDPGNTRFTPLAFDHYPWTHSLLLASLWALAFGLLAARGRTSPRRVAAVLFAVVLSHWLLDFVTHRPDLPLAPGSSPAFGLGLWNSIPATLAVEGTLFALGVAAYLGATRARDRVGTVGLWALLAFVGVVWAAGPFSPPPPGPQAVALAGLGLWLLVPWAAWVDSHREPRDAPASAAVAASRG